MKNEAPLLIEVLFVAIIQLRNELVSFKEENLLYFPSKKDTWIAILIWGLTLLLGREIFVSKSVVLYIIGILTIILFLWLWFGTGYRIEAGLLKIKSGPLRSIVKINDIKRVNASKTLLAGPALSMDRIEILYNKYDVAIVSPKDRTAFVRALLTENKAIEVDDKLVTQKSVIEEESS